MIDEDVIIEFIKETVDNAGVAGVVIGVSGGLDSAVVLGLCLEALGKDRVIGIYLPDGDPSDLRIDPCVMELANKFEIQIRLTSIYMMQKLFKDGCGKSIGIPMSHIAEINTKARIRMVILYAIANSSNLMVAGTSNKSELLTGYFTKFGDGACDFEPIGHLWKTDVFTLASQLGVPQSIIDRAPSADLYEGQTDEAELGMKYEELDIILRNYWENCPGAGINICPGSQEERIMQMVDKSQHKREMPRTPED